MNKYLPLLLLTTLTLATLEARIDPSITDIYQNYNSDTSVEMSGSESEDDENDSQLSEEESNNIELTGPTVDNLENLTNNQEAAEEDGTVTPRDQITQQPTTPPQIHRRAPRLRTPLTLIESSGEAAAVVNPNFFSPILAQEFAQNMLQMIDMLEQTETYTTSSNALGSNANQTTINHPSRLTQEQQQALNRYYDFVQRQLERNNPQL